MNTVADQFAETLAIAGVKRHCRRQPQRPHRRHTPARQNRMVDAGKDPETVRRHTLKIGAALRNDAVVGPEMAVAGIGVSLDFDVYPQL